MAVKAGVALPSITLVPIGAIARDWDECLQQVLRGKQRCRGDPGNQAEMSVKIGYQWVAFRHDLIAGLTVASISLPQGMAYACSRR